VISEPVLKQLPVLSLGFRQPSVRKSDGYQEDASGPDFYWPVEEVHELKRIAASS